MAGDHGGMPEAAHEHRRARSLTQQGLVSLIQGPRLLVNLA
jgi:hypothetical protein